jgi:replicative DNA helicase
MALIGSMFLAPKELLAGFSDRLSPDHFYVPAHALIYGVLKEFDDANKGIDPTLVTQALIDRGQIEAAGGPAYLTSLLTCVATPAHFPHYFEIVRDKYLLRRVITTCSECIQTAYTDQEGVAGLIDEVEKRVFSIVQERGEEKLQPNMSQLVMQAVEKLNDLFDRKGITGLPTGFVDLDKMIDGMHPAEMIVIAARPSMGKTALAMNIAEHVAIELGHAVAVFSLEMSTPQLIQRMLCSRARINLDVVRNGWAPQSDFRGIPDAANELSNAPLHIDDTPGLSILDLRARARRLKAKEDIKLIVIDYLQLLRSPSRRGQDNRQIEISEISAGIKGLAKELGIPIIVLSQLNRKPDDRGGRPRLGDLRESGSIEQDADVVGLLVRMERYDEETPPEERDQITSDAELIIAKQRNGPTGDVGLVFLKPYTRFENRAPERVGEPK